MDLVVVVGVESFERVRGQIGYCGIWCGSCVAGNGALRELTRRYEEMIENYGLREWAPDDMDYEGLSKGLAAVRSMPLCEGCRKGGGNPKCSLRSCACEMGLKGCGDCGRPDECKNQERLEAMREGALGAGLIVKDGEGDMEAWIEELKDRWPSRILFDGGG